MTTTISLDILYPHTQNMPYNIIDYNHHALHYILMTTLCYDYWLVLLDLLHPFRRTPHPFGNHSSVLCVYEICFAGKFFITDSISLLLVISLF